MFRFFRKLRQSMFQNGDTSKYFKYAIGEIALVVIGILIALQINNWNENRKLRLQELKYLKNLKTDIKLELKNNDSIINYRSITAKAAAHLLDYKLLSSGEDLMKFELTINQVFRRNTFIPTNNTYKELLSSGNLNFITNDSIKDYLLELDKKYVFIANMEHHMYREYEEYLYNVAVFNNDIINLFDIQKTANLGVITLQKPSEIEFQTIIPQYKKLLDRKEFKNGLRLSVMNNINLKNIHSDMIFQLQKLIEFIDKELTND